MNNKDRSLVGEEFHGWPQLDNLITATIKAFLICVEAQASAAADTSPHPRAGRLNVELRRIGSNAVKSLWNQRRSGKIFCYVANSLYPA
jgi:hypothetical protein